MMVSKISARTENLPKSSIYINQVQSHTGGESKTGREWEGGREGDMDRDRDRENNKRWGQEHLASKNPRQNGVWENEDIHQVQSPGGKKLRLLNQAQPFTKLTWAVKVREMSQIDPVTSVDVYE